MTLSLRTTQVWIGTFSSLRPLDGKMQRWCTRLNFKFCVMIVEFMSFH